MNNTLLSLLAIQTPELNYRVNKYHQGQFEKSGRTNADMRAECYKIISDKSERIFSLITMGQTIQARKAYEKMLPKYISEQPIFAIELLNIYITAWKQYNTYSWMLSDIEEEIEDDEEIEEDIDMTKYLNTLIKYEKIQVEHMCSAMMQL